jgi:hypothetical protein
MAPNKYVILSPPEYLYFGRCFHEAEATLMVFFVTMWLINLKSAVIPYTNNASGHDLITIK